MFYTPLRQSKKLLAAVTMLTIAWITVGEAGPVKGASELLMVEQTGCEWCAAWNEEIGGIYHLTDEGKRAPLRRQDLFDTWPADIMIRGQVHFTPTFILLEDGTETGRIEGYPGEDFFWPMLVQLLDKNTRTKPPKAKPSKAKPLKEGNN